MRKIQLTNYSLPNKSSPYKIHKLYSIGIYNRILHFRQEKQLTDFLAILNRFLNEILLEMNKFNAELYQIYRISWPYMDAYSGHEKNIRMEFSQADEFFKRAVSNTVGPNGNHFAFTFLIGLSDSHLKICELLNECLYKQRDDALRHQVRLISQRLKLSKARLKDYPDKEILDADQAPGIEHINRQ